MGCIKINISAEIEVQHYDFTSTNDIEECVSGFLATLPIDILKITAEKAESNCKECKISNCDIK